MYLAYIWDELFRVKLEKTPYRQPAVLHYDTMSAAQPSADNFDAHVILDTVTKVCPGTHWNRRL